MGEEQGKREEEDRQVKRGLIEGAKRGGRGRGRVWYSP